ncbi:ABC transporter ATP-binding protein [Cognatishimia sp.]|uniref:ABC transporter ATP-binding protein n=1 Tax=Cognatishimia sp. TaxID=2211648 RepID=UPI0035145C19
MIELLNVSKTYRLKSGRKTVLNGVTTRLPWKNTAILGRNGAGKSTFLRLISGIEEPDSGIVRRNKSFSWPIGFRGSFSPALSGLENVRFVARIYGQNTEELVDKVEDFAELGDFFYEPVRTYSSGMGARLAFGLSMAIKFEVFLVDEVMAVGDAKFQAKSKAAFKAMLPTSRIIMVSHSMQSLLEYCECGLVIEDGRMTYYNDVKDAIKRYHELNA